VAGLLFRLEVANLMGQTRKTCTSTLCKFVVPSTSKKKVIQPGKLSSFVFQQEKYSKLATSKTKSDAIASLKRRLEYAPMSNSGKELVSNKKEMRQRFFNSFKDVIPDSCFIQTIEGKQPELEEHIVDFKILSLKEHAQNFKDKQCYDEESYLKAITLSKSQISTVYGKTVAQSNSKFWVEQRKGRITASKFKKVFTRMESLKKSEDDPIPIVNEIMGENKQNPTWQMRHGISSERHAITRFKQMMRIKHRGIKFTNPGMTISLTEPYISVTPDLEIECTCCIGKGVCEVKCPPSVPENKAPSAKTYSRHLEKIGGQNKLRRSSEYYYQIQGQMAVLDRSYAYFFVFNIANRSFHMERIEFDLNFWKEMLSNLKLFWKTYVFPTLLLTKVPKPKPIVDHSDEIHTNTTDIDKILSQETLTITFEE